MTKPNQSTITQVFRPRGRTVTRYRRSARRRRAHRELRATTKTERSALIPLPYSQKLIGGARRHSPKGVGEPHAQLRLHYRRHHRRA